MFTDILPEASVLVLERKDQVQPLSVHERLCLHNAAKYVWKTENSLVGEAVRETWPRRPSLTLLNE